MIKRSATNATNFVRNANTLRGAPSDYLLLIRYGAAVTVKSSLSLVRRDRPRENNNKKHSVARAH